MKCYVGGEDMGKIVGEKLSHPVISDNGATYMMAVFCH